MIHFFDGKCYHDRKIHFQLLRYDFFIFIVTKHRMRKKFFWNYYIQLIAFELFPIFFTVEIITNFVQAVTFFYI